MPRAVTYPKPWVPTGHGSYREFRAGVFQVSWRPDGHKGPKRKKLLPCSELEAQQFLIDQHRDTRRARVGLAVSITWKDALQRYEERLLARKNSPDYAADCLELLKSLRDHVHHEPPEIQPLDIDGWLEWLANAAQESEKPGWARTCNKKRAMVHAFFRYLFRRRLIIANPVDATEPFREEKRVVRNLTPDEYIRVWSKSEDSLRDLLDFLLLTGCRFGEAAAMKRGDVTHGGIWLITDRKGKNDHKMPLPPLLLEIILRQPADTDGLVWHRWVKPIPSHDAVDKGGHPFVPGLPIDSFWFCKAMKERCKWAGVDYFHAHDLRHAAGSWADEEGMGTKQIQDLLGHTQMSTTLRYTHGDGTVGAKRVQELLLSIRSKAFQAQAK